MKFQNPNRLSHATQNDSENDRKSLAANEITIVKWREREGKKRRQQQKSVRVNDARQQPEKRKTTQIVVLKMWEKCKNFHFGFLLHMQNTYTHTHTHPHLRTESSSPVSQFVFHFVNCFASAIFVKLPSALPALRPIRIRPHSFLPTLCPLQSLLFKVSLYRLTIAFCSSETAGGYYVGWDYTDFILSECYARDFRQWRVFFPETEKRQTKDLRERC